MADSHDWDAVVEDLAPRLFRYFRARFSREQADDLTQESLIRLVRKVRDGAFNPDRGSLRMLGFGIAHYVSLEAARRAPLLEELDESLGQDGASVPETAYIEKDMAEKTRLLMRTLSPIEQDILALMIDQELTMTEIGRITGLPEGTVKSHVHRAKTKLRTRLAENDENRGTR